MHFGNDATVAVLRGRPGYLRATPNLARLKNAEIFRDGAAEAETTAGAATIAVLRGRPGYLRATPNLARFKRAEMFLDGAAEAGTIVGIGAGATADGGRPK